MLNFLSELTRFYFFRLAAKCLSIYHISKKYIDLLVCNTTLKEIGHQTLFFYFDKIVSKKSSTNFVLWYEQ